VQLEERCAAAWRYLLALVVAGPAEPTAAGTRAMSLVALTESAVSAVRWRRLLHPSQASVPFPGI
jgi:hypothetical protein